MVIGVHHTSLPVNGLERSMKFYCGVLGLGVLPRPDMGVPGVWLDLGNAQLHLIDHPESVDVEVVEFANPRGRHEAFEVADLAAMKAHLEANNITVNDAGSRLSQFWVQDPDGHVIEFIQPRR